MIPGPGRIGTTSYRASSSVTSRSRSSLSKFPSVLPERTSPCSSTRCIVCRCPTSAAPPAIWPASDSTLPSTGPPRLHQPSRHHRHLWHPNPAYGNVLGEGLVSGEQKDDEEGSEDSHGGTGIGSESRASDRAANEAGFAARSIRSPERTFRHISEMTAIPGIRHPRSAR